MSSPLPFGTDGTSSRRRTGDLRQRMTRTPLPLDGEGSELPAAAAAAAASASALHSLAHEHEWMSRPHSSASNVSRSSSNSSRRSSKGASSEAYMRAHLSPLHGFNALSPTHVRAHSQQHHRISPAALSVDREQRRRSAGLSPGFSPPPLMPSPAVSRISPLSQRTYPIYAAYEPPPPLSHKRNALAHAHASLGVGSHTHSLQSPKAQTDATAAAHASVALAISVEAARRAEHAPVPKLTKVEAASARAFEPVPQAKTRPPAEAKYPDPEPVQLSSDMEPAAQSVPPAAPAPEVETSHVPTPVDAPEAKEQPLATKAPSPAPLDESAAVSAPSIPDAAETSSSPAPSKVAEPELDPSSDIPATAAAPSSSADAAAAVTVDSSVAPPSTHTATLAESRGLHAPSLTVSSSTSPDPPSVDTNLLSPVDRRRVETVLDAMTPHRKSPGPPPLYNEHGVELVQPISIHPLTGKPRVKRQFARRYASLILAHIAKENAARATREAMEYRARKQKHLERASLQRLSLRHSVPGGSGSAAGLSSLAASLAASSAAATAAASKKHHGRRVSLTEYLSQVLLSASDREKAEEEARAKAEAEAEEAIRRTVGEDPTLKGLEGGGSVTKVKGDNSAQIETLHRAGNIFNAVLHADRKAVDALLRANPHVLSQRGPVGELPLHMCFLYHTPAHYVLAFYLMARCPHVICEPYLGTEYTGENILHIVIIQQDLRMVQRLVSMEPELLAGRAVGKFFSRGSPCYYGETILNFAACTGQRDMVKYLIEAGADLEAVDSNGNTTLHMMVVHSRPEMYSFVKAAWIEWNSKRGGTVAANARPLWHRRNAEGFTPMTLAAKVGNLDMFSFLLEEEKQKQWSYGPVTCYVYPLEQIDMPLAPTEAELAQQRKVAVATAASRGTAAAAVAAASLSDDDTADYSYPRALELIVNDAHLDLLMHPRMLELIKQKWSRFAARIFFTRFLFVLLYLALFTATTIHRQTENIRGIERWGQFEDTLHVVKSQPPEFMARVAPLVDFPALDALVARENEKASSRPSASAAKRKRREEDWADGQFGEDVREQIQSMNVTEIAQLLTPPEMLYDDGVLGGMGDLMAEMAHAPPAHWKSIIWRYPFVLLGAEIIVVLGALWKGQNELAELRSRGINNYFGASGSAFFENTLSLLFSSLMFVVLLLSWSGSHQVRMVQGLCSMVGWSYLFFFLLAFRMTGPMIVMIYHMLTSDVIRFLTVFGVFLLAFAQAFFVLFDSDGFGGFVSSVQACFLAMLGDFELDDYARTEFNKVAVGLLVMYVVVVTILLLNLLIAMMGSTYAKINEESEKQWHLERARIVFAIEHEMGEGERQKKSNKYWTVLGGQRYMQVLVRDNDHFRTKEPADAEAKDA